MANFEDILVGFLFLIYNITWLVFLIRKHYGQVTTKAGHIFELNVQLNAAIYNLFMLTMDMEVLPRNAVTKALNIAVMFSWWLAIAGSHIEAAIFLKTFNVNTMMTNTAGKIILATTICSFVIGCVFALANPSWKVIENSQWVCYSFTREDFYLKFIPSTVILAIVLAVMGFAVFRSRQFAKHEIEPRDLSYATPSQERLFIINVEPYVKDQEENNEPSASEVENDLVVEDIEVVNINLEPPGQEQEENNEASTGEEVENVLVVEDIELVNNLEDEIEIPVESPSSIDQFEGQVENDLVVENIELVNNLDDEITVESPRSFEQLSVTAMIQEISNLTDNQQNCIQCLQGPGISILYTLKKYMKNTLISLVILTIELPWYFTSLYGFLTDSGCENQTFSIMLEICMYYVIGVAIFLPYLIKIRLDRLSE